MNCSRVRCFVVLSMILLVAACAGQSTTELPALPTATSTMEPYIAPTATSTTESEMALVVISSNLPPSLPPLAELPDIALIDAISSYNLEVVQLHMEAGTNPDDEFAPEGGSALHTAVLMAVDDKSPMSRVAIDIVRVLIAVGADIEIRSQDSSGGTPLHWAAYWGGREVSALLIGAGANTNARDNAHQTPLDRAIDESVIKGKMDVVGLLVDNGAVLGD